MRLEPHIKKLSVVLVVILHSAVWGQQKKNPEFIGSVVEIEGKWILGSVPPQQIDVGQRLPFEGKILPPAVSPNNETSKKAYIKILFIDGSEKDYRCKNAGVCDGKTISLKLSASPPPSRLKVFIEVIISTFTIRPILYATAMARSENENLSDGVAKLDGGMVTLGDLFQKLPNDLYHLEFRRIDASGEIGRPLNTDPLQFQWSRSPNAQIAVNGLRPGLYRLNLLTKTGSDKGLAYTHSWALISDPAQYEEVRSLYMEAERTAGVEWGKDLRPETIRSLLRAYIHHLAIEKLK